MDIDRILLKSEELEVVFRLPGCYTRSRYDHSGMVEQVHLGENSFLSREIIGGGDGLGGVLNGTIRRFMIRLRLQITSRCLESGFFGRLIPLLFNLQRITGLFRLSTKSI